MEIERLKQTHDNLKPLYHLNAGDKYKIQNSDCYARIEQIIPHWDKIPNSYGVVQGMGGLNSYSTTLVTYEAYLPDGRLIHGATGKPIQMVEHFHKLVLQIE